MRKFKDIKEGEPFEFQGETFIKTGPTHALGLGGGKSFEPETEVK